MLATFCASGVRRFGLFFVVAVVAVCCDRLTSEERADGFVGMAGGCGGCGPLFGLAPPPGDPSPNLFLAIEQGRIDARIIVRDPYHAKLLLTNRSSMPQTVQLPDVLAARPVLAQAAGNIFGPLTSTPNKSSSPAPQTVGGTPASISGSRGSQGNGAAPFFGNGNNVFNIAPEQVRTVEIQCLCLEQGKPNPRSAVTYELVPLAEVSDDPKLAEVLKRYGRGEADREVAQAAAWHLANELSWDQLAELSENIAINAERPIFNTHQLRQAKQLVDAAKPQTIHVNKPAIKVPKL